MNGVMMCGTLGAMTMAAVAALSVPPAATENQQEQTVTRQFFITRQLSTAEPSKGRWEANLPPVGKLSIVVDDHGKRVLLNNKLLPSDRVIWQPNNLVMLIDESRQRQFEVALGEKGRIEYVRPNSWLEYRGANAPRVAIGIYTDPISPPLASQLGLDPDSGLLVTSVVENMPAFKSGVHQFDVITAVDDQDRVNQDTLKSVVSGKQPGQTIQLRLIRRSQPVELSVEVEEVQPLDPSALDPFFGGPVGMEDLKIDPDSFVSGDWSGWQFGGTDRPVIQFRPEGDAIVFSRPGFSNLDSGQRGPSTFAIGRIPNATGDIQQLEVQIKALTERIASLEAMIARLVGEPPAIEPAGIKP